MIITYKKYSTLDKMLLIDMRNLSIKEMIEMINEYANKPDKHAV